MDYEISSAAVIVPRIGERISHGLNSLKDRFLLDDTPSQQVPVSPLFQSIEEACPTDIINFHHEEEVVETKISPPTVHLPLDDLDSVDANDLFSFFLDNNSPVDTNLLDAKPAENPTSLPGSLPADLDIPLDLLDLLDPTISSKDVIPQTKSMRHESDSSSDPPMPTTLNLDDSLSCCSDTDYMEGFDLYGSGDEEYIERAVSSKKRGRGSSLAGPSVYLHNEDLVRGKPGQRLVLTAEEKRLLVQMGQRVPTTFPLTRSEERAIRTMRRKIRNKLSAKASRARRQEYLSNLESRVADCHKENQRLRNRITELEKDKRGLLANLRQMRSYMARLISGTYSASLKSDTATPPQPLLPLTIPKQRLRDYQGGRFTGAGTGLLVIALMILASSTLLPLPDVDGSSPAKDASQLAQNALSGRSRLLLNSKTETDVVVDSKDDNQQLTPSDASGFDDSDHDIPVIKSKVRILNKGPERKIIQSLELDDQLDPFLVPPNIGVEEGKKGGRHVPYSTEDL